jgi:hypothetical protein
LNETATTTVPFTIDVPTTLRHAITVMRGMCVGDRFLDGQLCSFRPCGLEVLVAQSIPYHRDRRFVIGVMDFEPDVGNALARWRAPHRTAGRFAGTAANTGEIGKALETLTR